MILHQARKRLYSDERWTRYITKKSLRALDKPVEDVVQRAVMQQAIKTQLDAKKQAPPIPPRPRHKKPPARIEVLYCAKCDDHFLRKDSSFHAHTYSAPLSSMNGPRVTG